MKKILSLLFLIGINLGIMAQEENIDHALRFTNDSSMKGLIWGNTNWSNYFSRIDDYRGNLRIMSDNSIYFTDINTGTGVPTNTVMYMNLNTGNVGVGTTTPAAMLDVRTSDNKGLWLNFNDQSAITFFPNNGNSVFHISHGLDNKLYVSQGGTVGASKLMTFVNNGNIGIGTTSPSEKLQVNGLIRIPAATNEDNNSPGIVLASNDDFLYDGQYLNHYGFGFHGYQDGSGTHVEPKNAYMSGYFGVDFFTGGQNRMRISRDGIVSIGTVNRQIGYKLAVNGNIKAKEIKVETGWSDFVFNKDYNLPTLKEVEQHINEKGHLKDIPSAEEVKENGIFLGDMNAKLLQKIEELTLYTIQQQKEISNLKNQTIEQTKEIDALKKENTEFQILSKRLTEIEKLLNNKKQ